MKLRAIWQENSPYSKLLLTVGTVLVFTTLLTVLASAIASAFFGIPYEELPAKMNEMGDATGIAIMKIIQAASSLGVFIFPALFLAFTFSDSWTGYLKLTPARSTSAYLLVFLLMIAAIPAINLMAQWNNTLKLPEAFADFERSMREMEDRAARITEAFMVMGNGVDLMTNLVVIALLPAIGEELFFRGLLQRLFSDWSKNMHVGIWVAAFVFSALHGQFYGFIPRLLLGGMFGYLFAWSGSLWIPVLAHLVNNGAAVIVTYLYQKGMVGFNPDEIGTGPSDNLLGLGSMALCIGLIVLFHRRTVSERTQPIAE